ncbi:hypothetical protein HMPREF2580_04065 [Staphylococcus sp. HMSC036D05]|uniref:ATP-binding cassette domain-containing protein n=1 Tax=Staphylococcus sp. HMSC036D05 TaxID=1715059 RepID=UPI0008A8BC22|nr:ATP-binding cassette domain-containing protein [Staphylococcus sp. HMSC036D05]OHO72668.1 hypothetical protein HMPREF2580_04065 [Staphylococcus sp. HMSC036D05]
MNEIDISQLNFRYPDKLIFKDAQFSINKGTINRIEGANGIGKTTLFHILSHNLKGELSVTPNIGFEFITTELIPFDELTGNELIRLFFKLNRREEQEIDTYIDIFKDMNIEFVLKNRYKNMSLGEKQKLNIMISFINKNAITLLDEPFNALDKESKSIFKEVLFDLSRKYNRTIMYISHNDLELAVDQRLYIYDNQIFEKEKYYEK